MDKHSKILVVSLLILLLISVSLAYYRFFVIRDYDIIEEEYVEGEDILGEVEEYYQESEEQAQE